MHTPASDDLTDKEQRARVLAYQLADLLNRLDSVHPGSVTAHSGDVTGLNVTIRPIDGTWTVLPN
jgi:soluble lytic murein transglycosylase-like protein